MTHSRTDPVVKSIPDYYFIFTYKKSNRTIRVSGKFYNPNIRKPIFGKCVTFAYEEMILGTYNFRRAKNFKRHLQNNHTYCPIGFERLSIIPVKNLIVCLVVRHRYIELSCYCICIFRMIEMGMCQNN